MKTFIKYKSATADKFITKNTNCLRDCGQITSVTLNGFCSLSKTPPRPCSYRTELRWMEYQPNQMKNTNPFCIVFEVLKVLLIIIWMQSLNLLFLVVLC